MSPELMLEGKTLWLTRPEGQIKSLQGALESHGAKVLSMPMLAITPLEVNAAIKSKVLNLDQYDLLFFISTNAANLGMELIQQYWPQFPLQLKIFAVGPTTAAVIENYDLDVEYPAVGMSTEALMTLDSLKEIENSKALIVRGVGGREILAKELQLRGASFDYLELYRRDCPGYSRGELAARVDKFPPDAVVVTSAEALANLDSLLRKDEVSLDRIPLFVSSTRIGHLATESGFGNTITMSGADDKAIIASLDEHL